MIETNIFSDISFKMIQNICLNFFLVTYMSINMSVKCHYIEVHKNILAAFSPSVSKMSVYRHSPSVNKKHKSLYDYHIMNSERMSSLASVY